MASPRARTEESHWKNLRQTGVGGGDQEIGMEAEKKFRDSKVRWVQRWHRRLRDRAGAPVGKDRDSRGAAQPLGKPRG